MVRRKLLHEQIAGLLREEIRGGARPGQRLDSDTGHAERFGVSVVTMRAALRLLCQEGLLVRRHGSGTYVRDSAAGRRIGVISRRFILEHSKYYFHRRTYDRVLQRIAAAGGEAIPVLIAGRADEPGADERLAAAARQAVKRGAEGIAVLLGTANGSMASTVEGLGVPVVGHDERGYSHVVSNDHRGLIQQAVTLLAGRGRHRIAFLSPSRGTAVPRDEEWYLLAAFRESLAHCALPYRPEWVCGLSDPLQSGSGWDHFHELWETAGEKPDAVLVGIDTVFPEAVMAILALGIRVPDDLMVVTHANRGWDIFAPFPVTRLEFDPECFADAIIDMLTARLQGENIATPRLLLPCREVTGHGTADAPGRRLTPVGGSPVVAPGGTEESSADGPPATYSPPAG